ncbi:thr operon leader peptide [Brenneria tiliae]
MRHISPIATIITITITTSNGAG